MKNELVKVINTFYTNTLKTAGGSKTKTPEDQNLYLLAFFGLIRSGYPFTITEVSSSQTDDGDGQGKSQAKPVHGNRKSENSGDQSVKPEKKEVVNIVIDDIGYTCDVDILTDRFGKEFITLTSEAKNKTEQILERTSAEDDDHDFVMPFVKFEDQHTAEKTETPKPARSEKKDADKKPDIPYIEQDKSYPDDGPDRKEYDSFLFNSHEIVVTFVDGCRSQYSATVYPVYMNMKDSLAADIFVVVTDHDGKIRCGMSSMSNSGQKGVNAEFDDCTLIIRGEWKNGKFVSKCGILSTIDNKQASLKEKVTYIEPTKRTSSFYLRHRGEDGTYLNVFPLSLLRNNPVTGLAPSVVMVEDGYSRKIYSGNNNTYLSLWYDGSQKRIDIFWAGNALNISISDPE